MDTVPIVTLVSMFESHPEPEETEMYGVMNHERVPVMTTGFAHIIMQVHIDCALCVCPVKQQAKQRLIEAKRLVPDSTRQ